MGIIGDWDEEQDNIGETGKLKIKSILMGFDELIFYQTNNTIRQVGDGQELVSIYPMKF